MPMWQNGTYEVRVRDPILGDRIWRVTPCNACTGTGRVHFGGDTDSACSRCDGAGEVGKFRSLDADGKAFGPWQSGEEA